MKFVIRDKEKEKPKENIIEFWLEKVDGDMCLKAKSNQDDYSQTICVIMNTGSVCLLDSFNVTGLRKRG